MCGICGFVSKQNITREQLKIMNDTMIHRGPDDSGEEIYPIRNGYQVVWHREDFPLWICLRWDTSPCIRQMAASV